MLKIVKDVCEDFHFGQSVQLSSSQKFDLKREHLGALRCACAGERCACAGERWGARVKRERFGQRQKKNYSTSCDPHHDMSGRIFGHIFSIF